MEVKSDDQQRLQILYMPGNMLVQILNHFDGAGCIEMPVFSEVPEDCQVIRVFVCHERRALGLVIRHPSFDVVPPGCLPPEMVSFEMSLKVLDIPGSFRRARHFVEHIQDHLGPDQEVVCKICGRSVAEIAAEAEGEAPAAREREQ